MLKHQYSMRSGFKVPLSNADIKVEARMTQSSNFTAKTAAISTSDKGAETTIIEIRRPLSYPESSSKQTSARKVSIIYKGNRYIRSEEYFLHEQKVLRSASFWLM